jgi:ABC-type nitrate/sulfonate/bicarbonate transport system ATPase subunit
VQVRGLTHRYPGPPPVPALDSVDVSVAPGEFVSLVGPSGCGKSTVLRVLAGLLVPTAGAATVGGESTIDRPGLAGYQPQRDLLLPWRRAMANAILGAEIAGTPVAAARQRAAALFGRFGLAGFEDAWPVQLSGGMRQRLALLRTFLLDRQVLLLDEPFGALDAITRRQMYEWLQDVWLADGRTVLFVTHDVEEALYLSDRVVVLSARPARVLATLDVPLTRPRRPDVVTQPEFVAAKARLLAALDGPAS